MLELQGVHPNCTYRSRLSKNNITKFNKMTVDNTGQARNYLFEPEYDLILYVYNSSNRIRETFVRYNVQYGYLYQETSSGKEQGFPVFREVPTKDHRTVNVWEINLRNEWDEFEVVRVANNFYMYSLPENYDLNKFFEGALKVIDARTDSLTKKYEEDINNQNKLIKDITETMTKLLG